MTGEKEIFLNDIYQAYPKVDLHRHLEGSLRLSTLKELARNGEVTIPAGADLAGLVQVQKTNPLTFQNFLSKFQTLRLFYHSEETIYRLAYEAVADAAADRVRYLELMFTPVALSRVRGFALADVVAWVIRAVHQAESDLDIRARLIVSVNRHESPKLAEDTLDVALKYRSEGIVGFNLAGNEAEFSAEPFKDIFKQAHQSGLAVTIHAGEWAGAQNIRQAIEVFQASRIGHGVRVLEDPEVVALARERRTPFEVCLTSNFQSGVTPVLKNHPARGMLNAGLNVLLNTDDPGVSAITLSDEYRLACRSLKFSPGELKNCILAAAKASFLPKTEQEELFTRLQIELVTL